MPRGKTRRVDIFWRTWNRDPERVMSQENVRVTLLDLEPGLPLEAILKAAWAAGVPVGNRALSGIFEVQTDDGIWSGPEDRPDENGPLWRNGKLRRGSTFTRWDGTVAPVKGGER